MHVPRPITSASLSHVTFIAIDARPQMVAVTAWSPTTLPPLDVTRHYSMSNPLLTRLKHATTPAHQDNFSAHSTGVPHQHINRSELLAILWGIMHSPSNTLIAAASDNKSAIAWSRKGHATNNDGDDIVATIHQALTYKRSRLCLAHVPGDKNPSDIFTRSLFKRDGVYRGGRPFPTDLEWQVTTWM